MKPSAVQQLLSPILGAGDSFDEGFGLMNDLTPSVSVEMR
jgi:hypothetical protein